MDAARGIALGIVLSILLFWWPLGCYVRTPAVMSTAVPRDAEPIRCPRCGEERLIEIDGEEAYCNVCGRSFRTPMPKPSQYET